jgi:hypothetical protein
MRTPGDSWIIDFADRNQADAAYFAEPSRMSFGQ